MTDNKLSPETLCAQALGWIDATTKALVPPIHMSTTNERDPDNEYRSGRSYIREDNPSWQVADLAALAEIAHGAGALLAVDSTCATPLLTQPIALGADLVMHAATKYLNGHSDVLAGTLTTARKDEFWERIRYLRTSG